MINGPIEPNADMRELAHALHQMHTALILEGFTEAQAMSIVGQTIAASILGGSA